MPSPLPEKIQLIAKEFAEILEKHYPGLTTKTYDSFGYPNREGSPALERIEMCLYIELIKAGVMFIPLHRDEEDGA